MSIQIPNLHASNRSKVSADGAIVFIKRRQDGSHSGQFTVTGSLSFNPAADAYPSGSMVIKVDLNDSVTGTIAVKTVEPLDTTGRATPTAYATGRCDFKAEPPPVGCRYWIMLADNKRADEEDRNRQFGFAEATRAKRTQST
jgi:hypothetical protein